MVFACLILLCWAARAQEARFDSAKPVWPEGRETEKNLFVGFRAVVDVPDGEKALLRLTGSTVYRAFVNGVFCGYGPARGPHGWYRVDEWDITPLLEPGPDVVAIEVAGYNVNTYYTMDQPSFLQAEVVGSGKVLAATGVEGYKARVLPEKVQKVERYSFQRPFSEVYRLSPGYDAWRADPAAPFDSCALAVTGEKQLLPRRVPYPGFEIKPALRHVSSGTVRDRGKFTPNKFSTIKDIGPNFRGYKEDELEVIPSIDLQKYVPNKPEPVDAPLAPEAGLKLEAGQWHIVDFGTNFTGFLGATVTCSEPTKFYMTFDEVLNEQGEVKHHRLGCINIVAYELEPGTYSVESFEPYTMRYAKLFVSAGGCEVKGVHIRRYANPDTDKARFTAANKTLEKLFTAGVETYAQNAVDVLTDCPSRERAGWLCDSFFTARTAKDLSGSTVVEKNFYENFLLPPEFKHLPPGMLPMCYPADHYNGVFIPNWAMWFVVELEEYAGRSGDKQQVDALKPKVLALFDYFKKFENQDGLLEKLESWVFVEWSKANDFVQDVNYPSNMLYAGALAAAGRTYGMPELVQKAEKIRETVRRQSFDGEFFVDNAVRKDGKLEVTRNRSEVCQYFAFFFDTATPESHPALWAKLRDEFGPKRAEKKLYPEVYAANSFVGNMLRVEILSRYGRCQQILDESIDYLFYMAERTGTLWENVHDNASCNHGFASHIVHTLYRDILGLYHVDTVNKRIKLRFADVTMPECEGTIPTADGPVTLKWRAEGNTLRYALSAPKGYQVEVENPGGKRLLEDRHTVMMR